MGKHTPGPWNVYNSDEVHNEAGERIAHCMPQHAVDRNYREDYANARLISAAPDLLEALYEALPFINDDLGAYKKGYVAGVEKKIRAAIAKAEGGQNEI